MLSVNGINLAIKSKDGKWFRCERLRRQCYIDDDVAPACRFPRGLERVNLRNLFQGILTFELCDFSRKDPSCQSEFVE